MIEVTSSMIKLKRGVGGANPPRRVALFRGVRGRAGRVQGRILSAGVVVIFHSVPEVAESSGDELRELLIAFSRMRRESDLMVTAVARDHGLHAPELRAISFIEQAPSPTPRGLAEYLALSLSATTAMIDRLAAAGFVGRTPNPEDGRSVRLELTLDGIAVLGEAAAIYRTAFGFAVAADRRADITAVFTQIADALAAVGAARKLPVEI